MGDFNHHQTDRAHVVLRPDQNAALGIFINLFMEQFGETSKADAILHSTWGFWFKTDYFRNSDHEILKFPSS